MHCVVTVVLGKQLNFKSAVIRSTILLVYLCIAILNDYADEIDRPEPKQASRLASPGRKVFWIV